MGNECSCQAKRIETRGMSLLTIFVNRQNSTTFSRPADARNQNTEGAFSFLLGNHPLDETMQTAVQNVLIWSGGVISRTQRLNVDTLIVVLVCMSTG